MLSRELIGYIRKSFALVPEIGPDLKGKARFLFQSLRPIEYKTYEFYLSTLERLINNVYSGNLGGEFVDIMANLISGQITQAYEQAWIDEGNDLPMPDYLTSAAEASILNQYDFVDKFYRDIVDARIDETPIDPLIARAQLWAGQWDVAYREATQLIKLEGGGNFVWRKGQTEKGCSTCASLDGITAPARTWEALDVHPRGYPNDKLECEGGGPANNCDCTLEETEERATRGAHDKIMSIISKG